MPNLLIRGGRVMDPANGVDAMLDVLVKDGRIARIAPQMMPAHRCWKRAD